ncbi:MAG: hypothetical protein IJ086_03695 [Clostridium sp.]|nr:hypothetical protein [Clostridium sp.]
MKLNALLEEIKGTDIHIHKIGLLISLIENINNMKDKISIDEIYSIIEDLEEDGIEVRICSECSNLMIEGYVFDSGMEYYCDDNCLHKVFTDEEWKEECEDNENSYWTQWN